ncbi:MAG: hypothetical protein HQK72_03350 [Desulfamplus sp.]|nr:hypothetical protein [Desulfamplus sp.]
MISGINMTGSYMQYQRQAIAQDTTPLLSSDKSSSESRSNNSDYEVNLSSEKSKIEQEYSGKQTSLKQEHENKIKQLNIQYSREQSQIEQEYNMKKRALSLNVYA